MSKLALALQRSSSMYKRVYRYCFISWLLKLGGNSFLAFYFSVKGSNRDDEHSSIAAFAWRLASSLLYRDG